MFWVSLLLQASVVEAEPTAGLSVDEPLLWRDIQANMSPESFAEKLISIDGIKSVEVTRKAKKPASVKIGYHVGQSIRIGDLTVSLVPEFVSDKLRSITLVENSCYSAVEAKLSRVIAALKDKYSNQQRVRVVDENGATIDFRQAFNNDEARVTLSVEPIENPYPQHLYGGSGFLAAANRLANSVADSNYEAAIASCPADRGRRAILKLQYVAQKEFARVQSEEDADRASKNRATKDGL